MAITGLYLEPDTAPYTSTTLSISSNLTDSDRFTSATGNYWYTHYSYGIDFGVATTISKLVMYGNTASSTPTGWYTTSYDSFKVFKSDDNATWTHVDDFDGPPLIYLAALQWGFELIFTQSSQTARYFKVVYIDTSTAAFASGGISARIGEVEYVELTGWNSNNKLKLIIDSSKVDSDLTNFPVLITLSSGTGITGFDATPVFDELSTISGTKKIAITDANDNQLYTEIERWDWVAEEANLWVKVPTIVSGTDTELYLYYDATVSGNTTYVGDTGDTPAESVWDANFVGVWHMAQDPNGDVADAIKDSTSNINHGTPAGTMTTADLVDGQIGKAIDFDGSDDRINLGNTCSPANDLTISAIIKTTTVGLDYQNIMAKVSGATMHYGFYISTDELHFQFYNGGWKTNTSITSPISVSTNHDVVIVFDTVGNTIKFYVDGVEEYSGAQTADPIPNAHDAYIGNDSGAEWFSGIIDEARISSTARPAAWIKATYYSSWDDFITFSEITAFIFSNPIPADLSTVYGLTQQLYLTTTVTGLAPSYVYDATFYDSYDDSVINSTISGIQGGQPAGVIMSTPSGINYQWYLTVVSSGIEDVSSVYTFTNRFLCQGMTSVNDVLTSGIDVRLYLRSTGELIGSDISTTESGIFSIETIYNENHYVVGLYNSDDTNAIVYDWIKPE